MIEQSLVSIIIPAYRSRWFEFSLRSAIQQDYPRCEIIIGDDCPTDDILNIVNRLKEDSPYDIIYRHNTPPQGEMENITVSAKLAKGEYIKFLHDDDILKPNSISVLMAAIKKHPDIVMATARRECIDERGRPIQDELPFSPPVNVDSVLHGQDVVSFQVNNSLDNSIFNFIGEPSSVLIHTASLLQTISDPNETLATLGGEIMHFAGGITMCFKVLQLGHLAYVCESLSQYRLSREQTSQLARDNDARYWHSRKIFPEMIKKMGWSDPKATKDHVRVAPLSTPCKFTKKNITTELKKQLEATYLSEWFGKRKLIPIQEKLIKEYFSSQGSNSNLTIFIDVRNKNKSLWDKTIKSLNLTVDGLSWDVVALTEQTVDYIHQDIEILRLNKNNEINQINKKLNKLHSDWVFFITSGYEFLPSGLISLAMGLSHANHCHAVYADEIYMRDGNLSDVVFRPDFNFDLLLSHPKKMAYRWLFRREWLLQTGGFNPSYPDAFEFEMLIRLIETTGASTIGHLAEPLVVNEKKPKTRPEEQQIIRQHLLKRGYVNAEVLPTQYGPYQIKYHHQATPLVSIIVLIKEGIINLTECLTELLEKTRYVNYEILIVTSDGSQLDKDPWLQNIATAIPEKIKVIRHSGSTWQRARMANVGTLSAQGDYLMFINAGLRVTNSEWLNNMLNHAQRPEVAIVGAKQIDSDNRVHHAGYILGLGGITGEPYSGLDARTSGNMERLHTDQNYSAVSGDFMLVRKEVFIAENGFDTDLMYYDDVDFCLRVRKRGLLSVWTPHVQVLQTRPSITSFSASIKQKRDEPIMFERWRTLIQQDPAYNPHLTRTNIADSDSVSSSYLIDSQLSWRPLSWSSLPVVVANTDRNSGDNRIIKPFQAMQETGLIDGKVLHRILDPMELEYYNPDIIVVQHSSQSPFYTWGEKIRHVNKSFKVYELDDDLFDTPLTPYHDVKDNSEHLKILRSSLALTDRLVVPSEALAEELAPLHREIVVVPNYLPEDWWGTLQSLKNQGEKPRIGWAGSSYDAGDLAIITDIVKEFSNDVEWIFLGVCPQELRPYIHEFHTEVDPGIYPAKLASLNLDLALAPAEDNLFNACRSNLRLLEYGACAIPVICSDVMCYRGELPVTRVPNKLQSWREAIKMHLDDPLASAKMGLSLQNTSRSNWMLSGENLLRWSKAWQPN